MRADSEWAAPAHTPLEVLRTLRRFETAGHLTAEQANAHARTVPQTAVRYLACEPWVLNAVWDLRHNVSPYDAPYAAAALHFECPLLTLDARLARAVTSLGIVTRVPTAGSL
jgi:predicted nucleic acid-binding protein